MVKNVTPVIVRAYHPGRRPLLIIVLMLFMLVTGWLLFDYGQQRSGYDRAKANTEKADLLDTIERLTNEVATLEQRGAIVEKGQAVDQLAYQDIKDDLKDYQVEIMELRKTVSFYRGIVGSSSAIEGMRFQYMKVVGNGLPRGFHYKIILTMLAKNSRTVKGRVHMMLEGVKNGKAVQLSHKHFFPDAPKGFRYRFKYFQEIEGDIVLPEGFEAVNLKLKTLPQDSSNRAIEKTYNWSNLMI